MADIKQLERALVNADKAGDTEAAKKLARAILQARQAQQDDQGFSVGKMVENIPGSAANLVGDMWHAVTNPVSTSTALGKTLVGGVQKLIPGEQENEKYADAVVDAAKARYGSLNAISNTLQNDPVGALADFSGAVSGVGLLGGATKAGRAVRAAGAALDPVSITANTAKGAVNAVIPEGVPRGLYQSAAKFSTVLPEAERSAIIQTALDNKFLPTQKGVAKLQARKGELISRIDSLIDKADATGKTIPKDAVFGEFKKLRRELGGPRLEGARDVKLIDAVAKRFSQHMEAIGKDSLTPRELQQFKVDVYKQINFDLEQGKANFAKNEARKAAGRSAKNILEDIAPGVGPLNESLGQILALEPHLQRSAGRIGNLNNISLNAPLNIGAGSAIGGPYGTAAGAGLSILEKPQIKARLATLLNAWNQQGLLGGYLANSVPAAVIRQGLLQGGRLGQADDAKNNGQ